MQVVLLEGVGAIPDKILRLPVYLLVKVIIDISSAHGAVNGLGRWGRWLVEVGGGRQLVAASFLGRVREMVVLI